MKYHCLFRYAFVNNEMKDSSLLFLRLLQRWRIWTQEEHKKWWCQQTKVSFSYSSLSWWNLNLPSDDPVTVGLVQGSSKQVRGTVIVSWHFYHFCPIVNRVWYWIVLNGESYDSSICHWIWKSRENKEDSNCEM